MEFGEGEGKVPLDNIAKKAAAYKPKERVIYKMIKEYIEAKYGFKVHCIKGCAEDICMYILVALSFTLKHIGTCGKIKKNWKIIYKLGRG